jgi:superfamily II DNA/RNA helicase
MLPIVDYCLKKKKATYGGYDSSNIPEEVYPLPYALIILPTRELALQICEQGRKFAAGSKVQVHAIYGGCNYNGLYRQLLKGCDILCATPGILRMMVQRGDVRIYLLIFFLMCMCITIFCNSQNRFYINFGLFLIPKNFEAFDFLLYF